ncbi:hypothetical protein C8F01DRAFT_1121519 [Mycena amicta]|nr:hypothetical protein C8F01DRAFT_1121519 [Mycena amicta]
MYESAWPFLLGLCAVLYFGPWGSPLTFVVSTLQNVITNPQAAATGELLRFIFLSTIVDAGKKVGQMIYDSGPSLFVVKAEFGTRDFAYDWVLHYLDSQRIWRESRSFKVIARNATLRPNAASALGEVDGHPDPVYEPSHSNPSLFRWRGYWITVNKTTAGYAHYDTGEEVGGTLVISIWSRKRQILDDFVTAAREFYIKSNVLPRRVNSELDKEPSGALLSAEFNQSDLAYDWMLAYLRSANALKGAMHFTISTKQSDLGWGDGPKDAVRFMPANDTKQQFLFTSPNSGKSTWLQVVVKPGQLNWTTNSFVGGSIGITLYSSDKAVLADLIETARRTYIEHGVSRVTVHLTDNRGEWAKTVSKSRRPMSTLILPTDVKESLLEDAREFLASERWYNQAGIPHRRGYLLYGEPGTGKSSTIHALAGELGLEIYFVSLANPGIDDYTLAKLISDTPARCILLMEDIDCAFASRDETKDDNDDDELEQPLFDKDGKAVPRNSTPTPPKSSVTLSGLLNVLDSVSSEEGRLMFATTNHIENLDSALIRAGRMDVKIQYRLADSNQLERVFMRFFPLQVDQPPAAENTASMGSPAELYFDHDSMHLPTATYTATELDKLATTFATAIPPHTYSIAQVQGYLLTRKRDPVGAVDGVQGWLKEQEEERRAMAEMKAKRKEERRKRMRAAKERAEAAAKAQVNGKVGASEEVVTEKSEAHPAVENGHGLVNGAA